MWAVAKRKEKKKKRSFVRVSQSWGGIWLPSCYLKCRFFAGCAATVVLCKVHIQSQTLLRTFESFIQMHDGLIRAPRSFPVTHALMVYLWGGFFWGFTAHFPARLEQSCCEAEESGAIFLAPNHSIPSARWSLLINHVTMFHNLGITASMSLITICALLEGSQRPKR